MPRVEASVQVPIPVELAFAVSQTQGEIRYRWDPFVKSQRLLNAELPGKGVQTETRSRHGFRMVSEYTSFRAPTQVGMKMIEGPWFFATMGGGWHFADNGDGTTKATWRYVFSTKPAVLSPVAERIGSWLLGRDITRRINGYAQGCTDPVVLEAAQAQVDASAEGGEPV